MFGEFEFQVPRTLGRWTAGGSRNRTLSVPIVVPPRSSEGYRLSPESNCSNINYNRRAIRMFERSGFEQVRAGTGGPVPLRHTSHSSLPLRLEPRLLRGPRLAHDTRHPAPRGAGPQGRPDPVGPDPAPTSLEEPAPTSQSRAGARRYPLAGGAPGAGGRVPSPCSTVPRESKNPLALPIPTTTH